MKTVLAILLVALATPALQSAERIDPGALALLQRMSNTLASANSLTLKTRTIFEVPSETGQFVTSFSTADIALKRPDKLRALLRGESPWFDFYYDGSTVSSYAPGRNVYCSGPAAPTLDTILAGLMADSDSPFATVPLFFSDPYRIMTKRLTSAVILRPVVIDGTRCEHLACRSARVDWEIWIESNARSLPRRLIVTFTDRTNSPRNLVEFWHWNLHPWLRDGDFVFRRPRGARDVPYADVFKAASLN